MGGRCVMMWGMGRPAKSVGEALRAGEQPSEFESLLGGTTRPRAPGRLSKARATTRPRSRASRSSRSHTLLGDQTRVNDLVGAGHGHHCGRGGCSDGRGRARQRHRLRRSLDRLACDGCRHCMQRGRPGRHGHRRRYIRGNGDHRRRSWRGRGVSRHGHRDCELLGRRSRRQCDRRIGSPHGDRHLYRRGSPVVSVRVTTEPSGTSQPLRSTSAPVWPPP
jgi:hypothetical protein